MATNSDVEAISSDLAGSSSGFEISNTSDASKPATNIPPVAPHHLLPPQEEENILRRSLKEINEDIKKMEDFITVTEDIIRRERERDREFYSRERHRKMSESETNEVPKKLFQVGNAQLQPFSCTENQLKHEQFKLPDEQSRHKEKHVAPSQPNKIQCAPAKDKQTPTLEVAHEKPNRKIFNFNPLKYKTKLSFRNGKIGCIEDENVTDKRTNVEKTHAMIRCITDEAQSTVKVARPSLTSNISGILSEESSQSMDDIPNSNTYFNFDCSIAESDDHDLTEEDLFLDSLSEMEMFHDINQQVPDAIYGIAEDSGQMTDELGGDEPSTPADNHIDIVHCKDESIVEASPIGLADIEKPPRPLKNSSSNNSVITYVLTSSDLVLVVS